MLRGVLWRRVAVGILAATLLVFLLGGGAASAQDPAPPLRPLVEPTTIDVSPYSQPADGSQYPDCPAHVTWWVYLGGGLGTWDVDIAYGDGGYGFMDAITISAVQVSHDFTGCESRTFVQGWSATSAGGTDSTQTYVNYN